MPPKASRNSKVGPKKEYDYSDLHVGMVLQAEAEGTWYAADIVQVSTAKSRSKAPIKIAFKGYSGYDTWVGGDRLKSKSLKTKTMLPSTDAKTKVSSAEEWTLFYHGIEDGIPKFKGRGEPMRMLFEDAGVPFTQTADKLYGPEAWCDAFRGEGGAKLLATSETVAKHTAPYPVMFPPMIWHRPPGKKEVFINQSFAVMRYISSQLGYMAKGSAQSAVADQVALDVFDYVSEGRRQFHPLVDGDSYASQKEEADKRSKEWSQKRMGVWLQHFEKLLEKSGKSEPAFVVGSKATYADMLLLYALQATEAQFNTEFYEMAWDKAATIPKCKAFKAWMEQRPRLMAYFASERCPKWCGDSMM